MVETKIALTVLVDDPWTLAKMPQPASKVRGRPLQA